jgi:lipid-A-disaccharide synthase
MAPDTEAYVVGGPALRRAGAEIIVDSAHAGAIGIFQGAKLIPRGLAALSKLKRELVRRRPDVLVLVDCGAFNTRVAPFARRERIPTLYYFPPGSWRRGLSDRARGRWLGDEIVSPFPWNAEDLRAAGHDAHFFGHPLLDLIDSPGAGRGLREELGIRDGEKVIGLLPGSREAEIAHLWVPMVRAAALIRREVGSCRFVVPLADNLSPAAVRRVETWRSAADRTDDGVRMDIRILAGRAYDVMRASELIITASGTATLEAAIVGCPMVIVYRADWLAYLQYSLVKRSIPFIGMPNNIAGREICPELIQGEATAERIAKRALVLLRDPARQAAMREELARVRQILGPKGAIRRTAERVLALASRRPL